MKNDIEIIYDETDFLFNYNFNDQSISSDTQEYYEKKANELINNYNWEIVYECWYNYLIEKCDTPEKVINWANLFFWYGGCDNIITNPYPMLGYLYFKVDTIKYVDEAQVIFDSIVTLVLEKNGDYSFNDNVNYTPESDTRILKYKEIWQEKMVQSND